MKHLKVFNTVSDFDQNADSLIKPWVAHIRQSDDNSVRFSQNETFDEPERENENAFRFIDLDLPSGTKWANMNLGSQSLDDPGLYYQYGSLEGIGVTKGANNLYTADPLPYDVSQSPTNVNDYSYYQYSANGITRIKNEYNPVVSVLGAQCDIPTNKELAELRDNTTQTIVKDAEVPYIIFASKVDPTKQIQFPLCGIIEHTSGTASSVRDANTATYIMHSDYTTIPGIPTHCNCCFVIRDGDAVQSIQQKTASICIRPIQRTSF